MENTNIIGKEPVLDLRRLNIPLNHISKELNGKSPFKRGENGRFERSQPQNKRGVIIQALIYSEFSSLESFADTIKKTKGWVSMLICNPEKVKITEEIQEKISQAFGVRVLL